LAIALLLVSDSEGYDMGLDPATQAALVAALIEAGKGAAIGGAVGAGTELATTGKVTPTGAGIGAAGGALVGGGMSALSGGANAPTSGPAARAAEAAQSGRPAGTVATEAAKQGVTTQQATAATSAAQGAKFGALKSIVPERAVPLRLSNRNIAPSSGPPGLAGISTGETKPGFLKRAKEESKDALLSPTAAGTGISAAGSALLASRQPSITSPEFKPAAQADTAGALEAEQERLRRRAAGGRRSTILTSPLGVTGPANIGIKTLLGA
jgi:hypothetical protein